MADEKLTETFKRAAKIASVVPESMQEAAFHRALDLLAESSEPSAPRDGARRARAMSRARETADTSNPVEAFRTLDRSRAGDVDSQASVTGKSLALLLVARRELQIDGLSAPQIASILTEKFRSRVARRSVAQALDHAGKMVDGTREGRSIVFRLMDAGEKWLDVHGDGAGDEPVQSTRRRPRRISTSHQRAARQVAAAAEPKRTDPKAAAQRRRTGRGPKAAVEELIDDGWFKSPRGLTAIRGELADRYALRFKPTDLSPTLIRLLREKRLHRAKNAEGQFEYQS